MSTTVTETYYVMAGGERRGPFSFEQLLQQPIHRQTPVWYKGMSGWKTAEDLPRLVDLVPPPPPVGRATLPRGALADYAHAMRVVNLGIGGFLVVSWTAAAFTDVGYGWFYFAEAVTRSALIYYAVTRVRFRYASLWAAAGLVPLLWLAVLIVLHQRLYRRLTSAGYRVSFLGRFTPPTAQQGAGSVQGGAA